MSIFTFVSRVEIFIKHNDLQFIHLFSELIYLVSATQQKMESRGSGIGPVEKKHIRSSSIHRQKIFERFLLRWSIWISGPRDWTRAPDIFSLESGGGWTRPVLFFRVQGDWTRACSGCRPWSLGSPSPSRSWPLTGGTCPEGEENYLN